MLADPRHPVSYLSILVYHVQLNAPFHPKMFFDWYSHPFVFAVRNQVICSFIG